MKSAILSLSGGLDSTTLLAQLKDAGYKISLVYFYYGSKHGKHEQAAAIEIASHYDLTLNQIDLSGAMIYTRSNLMLTGDDIPEGHYEADSMKLTVVPGRNLIFIAMLASLAESHNLEEVWLGVHAGDHAIYPDCRPEFLNAARSAIQFSSDNKVDLVTPHRYNHKADLVKIGLSLGAPYHLTRTCYKNQLIACGRCGSCQERLEAFKLNNAEDPIDYETRVILPKV